jgi:hypothetical protein
MKHFPIDDALPEADQLEAAENDSLQEEEKKKFGDQLDWWQRIGRWR